MLVSYRHNFLFVHIPKTGGTSVRNALAPFGHDPSSYWQNQLLQRVGISVNVVLGGYKAYQFRKHARVVTAKAKLPADVYDSLFKFCFVRNTWELLVSNYNFILSNPQHKRFSIVRKLSFADFIDFAVSRGIGFQLDQITSPQGELMVDYIGHFKRLAADFGVVQQRLGIVAPLAHLNRTNHRDYRTYYDRQVREKVSRIYAREIEMFGFDFDGGVSVEYPVRTKTA